MPYALGLWSYYDGFGWGWAPGGYGYGYGGWGGGGWGARVGTTPFHYEPPRRPRPGPINPHRPQPVVVVNRFHGGDSNAPVRPRGGPVTVAGSTVQPLRPVGSRPVYNHEPAVSVGGGYRAATLGPQNNGPQNNGSGNTPSSGFAGGGAAGIWA